LTRREANWLKPSEDEPTAVKPVKPKAFYHA
jgi:hypothetical protein